MKPTYLPRFVVEELTLTGVPVLLPGGLVGVRAGDLAAAGFGFAAAAAASTAWRATGPGT